MSSIKKISQIIFALFFYSVSTLAIFWDPIINKFGSIQWDAIGVHFFNLLFSSQTWQAGTFPLWTPYIFNGFPQVADLQVAIFYPINLLISFFTTFTAPIMQYQLIVHYFLAGFFGFLLAKHISKNFFFSLAAGAVYAFSGFMVGHGSHVGMQNASAWLPLLFWLLILALEKRRLIYGLICGLFLGITILAGHFQMALYGAYALGFYFAFDFLWSLTTLIKVKIKQQKEHKNMTGKFSPKEFIIASPKKEQGEALLKKFSIILAVFVIAFLISAVQLLPTYELTAKSQRVNITLEMSQTESLDPDSLWGLLTPNYKNVSHGEEYSGPWDRTQNYLYLGITILILAILGAIYGITQKGTRKMTIFWILLLASSLVYSLGKYGFLQKYYFQSIPFFDKIRAPSNMILLFNLAIIALASILFANINRFLENKQKYKYIKYALGVIMGAIIIYEIFTAVSLNELLYARKSPDTVTQKPWIAENIQSEYSALDEIDKFRVFKVPEFQDNSTQMWQIYAFDGYNPLMLQRYGAFVDTMVKNANLIDLAGIKYLPCEFIPEQAEKLEKVGNLCINKDYYPKAFFVDHFIVAENDQDALSKLNSIGTPREVVILEKDPKVLLNQNSRNQSLAITDAKPGFWKLSSENDSDAFMVFAQTHYPGWTAKIDGQITEIYQADYLFQAISVPWGEHEIIFEYESPLLKKGATLTIIGLIVILFSIIFQMLAPKIIKKYLKNDN